MELWGLCIIEELPITVFPNNTYKTLRAIGDDFSWLFIKWCNNEMELYNTKVSDALQAPLKVAEMLIRMIRTSFITSPIRQRHTLLV